ncbi:hypothetical protein Tsubulata_038315 [Turnera subulata]|uniref:Endonuclease/exonuclease/phosphatase domain-containing protein n=1 Tax=Turnera subulata TaxID=218843 RepID=A0A9Q0JI38_9ROSI|nr:hypothetical protein Tsubulata_038315 [Turnera subulata]
MKEMKTNMKPLIAIVVEPRISGRKAANVIRRLGYTNSHRVDARGYSGGIWVLWNEREVGINILLDHTQFIHMQACLNGATFLATAIYASPQEKWRRFLWNNLKILSASIDQPWVLLGDFNAVLQGSERRDSNLKTGVGNKLFQDCVEECRLIDVQFMGPKFTWASAGRKARLDRALCNDRWLAEWPDSSTLHLPRICSDHNPILLQLDDRTGNINHGREFRFQSAWLLHADFPRFLSSSWPADASFPLAKAAFRARAQIWNKTVFGNIHLRKRRLLARISGIQRRNNYGRSRLEISGLKPGIEIPRISTPPQ